MCSSSFSRIGWVRTIVEAPLPHPRPECNFIHPRQLSPFPERLKLPFPSQEICRASRVLSPQARTNSLRGKAGPDATLVRHMVDVQKAVAEFRETSERRHDTPSETNRFNKGISNRSPVQKRLEYLQLESRAPTRKRRCLREADRRQVARHHFAGSI